MTIKKLAFEFVLAFVVTLVIVIIVTFLWNLIGHGTKIIDWETVFRFAIIFGILLTWVNNRKSRENASSGS
jgi:Na+/melibiose symporter-like transporter